MTITTIAEYGYLETPYLSEFPYLQPAREDALGVQFEINPYQFDYRGLQITQKIIADALRGVQFDGFITKNKLTGTQFDGFITKQNLAGVQVEQEITIDERIGLQWSGLIEGKLKELALQHEQILTKVNVAAWQMNVANTQEPSLAVQWLERFYTDTTYAIEFLGNLTKEKNVSVQFEGLNTGGLQTRGLEFTASKVLPHKIAGDYLNDEPYLSEYQYLAPVYHVPMGVQFDGHLTKEPPYGEQFTGIITKENTYGLQTLGYITKEPKFGLQFDGFITKEPKVGTEFEGFITKESKRGLQFDGYITKEKPVGFQFDSVYESIYPIQFRAALYNTTNLRILLNFPSRGLTGTNWSATSTAPSSSSSFSVNNLNTDIVEQYWRSADGITSATITCDTQLAQGVYTDTVGILNHNLSGSATVRMQSSNDPSFGFIGVDEQLTVEAINMYFIAPQLPLNAYRYWRFIIQDTGNADDYLRIGTVVFGASIIFTNESFVDRVRFGRTQYVDKVYTEGFTNVSNDRGKKAFLELEFRSLRYGKLNWLNMNEVFTIAGVSLKCLWIPVPLQASRFALFGKLNELPSEEHNYKTAESDFVDFNVRVDESL